MTTHYRNVSAVEPVHLPSAASRAPATGPYKMGLKRVFDIAAILVSLPIVLPVMLVLILMVAIEGRPVFYWQARIGRKGRIYRIWKLRTMELNADDLLRSHLAHDATAATEWASTQKLKNDPRITPVGRILRKCSLDELPQLWNVFTGDMSLVGPRPMMPEQRDIYPGEAYFDERPGITGTWQVSERNKSTFADRARFDTDYIDTMSFAGDIKLLLATVVVVFRGTGY